MDDDLLRGIDLVRRGEQEQAQACLARVVRSHPDSEEGWLWLGHSLDDLERRRYCYQRVLAINPENSEAWQALGGLYNPHLEDASLPGPAGLNSQQNTRAQTSVREPPQQESAVGMLESNAENKPGISPLSLLQPALFGFLLALVLLVVPFFFLIRYGVFDGYLLSAGMVDLPPMPPVYPRFADMVVFPTQIPLPETPFSERIVQAEPLITQAKDFISQDNYYDALPLLNEAVAIVPEYDEPYFLRAYCTYFLLQYQRSLDEHLSNIHTAIFDLDNAIRISPDIGNYHALRGLFYADWAELQELTANRNYLFDIARKNFIAANALGVDILTAPEFAVIKTQIRMGECEEGLQGIDSTLEDPALSSVTVSDIYLNQAIAYSCLGKMDEALESIRMSMQYGNVTEDQKMVESAILYQKGEPDEALKILDGLIVQSSSYGGERYLLRALIFFEKGDWDETYRSMLAGGGNTWLHGGLYSYVQGKMGLQLAGDENRAKSIDALQYAEASMPVMYNVLRSRIQTEIIELGSQPWEVEVSFEFQPTPLPENHARPTARPTSTPLLAETPLATTTPGRDEAGTPLPDAQGGIYPPTDRGILIVDIQAGTGPLTLPGDKRQIFRFQPSSPLSIAKALDVIVYLDAEELGVTPPLLYEFWNPRKRTWTSIESRWKEQYLLYPGDYVLPEGDVYMSVRNLGNAPFSFDNLSIIIVIETPDGSLQQFGTK